MCFLPYDQYGTLEMWLQYVAVMLTRITLSGFHRIKIMMEYSWSNDEQKINMEIWS
jgi:hypothetical protein